MAKKLTYKFGADLTELEKGILKVERKLQNMARKVEKVGMTMTKAFTIPLAAIGTLATKAGLDVEKSLAAIARGTGATGKALKGLEGDWKRLAGAVSQSFEVSAKVIADYNTRLGLTGSSLNKISKQALDASRMLGEDINVVVTESAKSMRDWGVATGDMAEHMDKMFVAAQSTGISMGTLGTSMAKYGSALRAMGFTTTQTIATLAEFEKQGQNTELIMGSLRIALGKMAQAGIKDAGKAFRDMVKEIKDAKSPTEATKKAIDLFGSRAGPAMAMAIREGRFEIDELVKALEKSKDAIEKASDATKTFGERWKEVKNKVSLAIAPIGSEILKIAEDWLPAVERGIKSLGETIEGMSDTSKKSMVILAGVFGIGGPFLIGLAAVSSAVIKLGAMFAALAASPAFLTVMGVAATVGAGVAVGKSIYKKTHPNGKALGEEAVRKMKIQEILNHKPSIPGKIAPPLTGQLGTGENELDKLAKAGKKAKAGKSDTEILVTNIANQIKYMNANADEFLPILDQWKAKLKPMSEDWMKTVDLITDITEDGENKRVENFKKAQEEIENAQRGTDAYFSNLGWQNNQGLLSDGDYLATLKKSLSDAADELERLGFSANDVSNWTPKMISDFEQIQSIVGEGATKAMTSLRNEFEHGKISQAEYQTALEKMAVTFATIPQVVKAVNLELETLHINTMNKFPTIMSQVKASWDEMEMSMAMVPTSLGNAFESAIRGSESLGDALKGLLQDLGAVILKAMFMKAIFGGGLGGLFGGGGVTEIANFTRNAKGNVFGVDGILPFAKGGIVNAPTIFPFANGTGLMGEAGPEAIMPLKRGADGKLGVEGGGGGGTNITMNINAIDSQSFVQMMRTNRAVVESLVIENIYRNGSVRKAIQQGV